MDSEKIQNELKSTINNATHALLTLQRGIDDSIYNVYQSLARCKGKIVVIGQGKSAIVAQKFVATLNSVSIISVFLNGSDALHGDIGILNKDDAVLFVSKSGNSKELELICNIANQRGIVNSYIGCNPEAQLNKLCNNSFVFDCIKEADDFNIIPTHSTLGQMAILDAIAIALIKEKKVNKDTFGANHPGGDLGKVNFSTVKEYVENGNKPNVKSTDSLKVVINSISKSRKGVTVVIDQGKVIGVITDGDLRRMLEKTDSLTNIQAKQIMTSKPKWIASTAKAYKAFDIMKKNQITQLVVMNGEDYVGIIHLHDLIKNGFK